MTFRFLLSLSLLTLLTTCAFAQEDKLREPQARIRHLLEAAENLDAAGMQREANDIRKQAEKMASELSRHNEQHPGEVHGEVLEQLREIHHVVNELRQEVRELRHQLAQLQGRAHEPSKTGQAEIFRYIPGPNGPVFHPFPNSGQQYPTPDPYRPRTTGEFIPDLNNKPRESLNDNFEPRNMKPAPGNLVPEKIPVFDADSDAFDEPVKKLPPQDRSNTDPLSSTRPFVKKEIKQPENKAETKTILADEEFPPAVDKPQPEIEK